ncbi:MAG: FtsX-like permease family protein, partial [Clostridiales bacterium]|nr:FtsX-like permease family protein [Clostridiales bacterium]
MFFKLVLRNSKRSRKENVLFMSSMLISVIAFYVVLSLENQDVIRYLKTLESDAVTKLIAMTGGLYIFTLVVLFFMIYYASRYQIERRNHELGVYLMMGMRKGKLLMMLLAEELAGTFISLIAGIPAAVLLSELMSLMTVKLVGIGFIGHQTTFSIRACLLTCLGFFVIKLAAFLIISFKLAGKEIGTLLADESENIKKQK